MRCLVWLSPLRHHVCRKTCLLSCFSDASWRATSPYKALVQQPAGSPRTGPQCTVCVLPRTHWGDDSSRVMGHQSANRRPAHDTLSDLRNAEGRSKTRMPGPVRPQRPTTRPLAARLSFSSLRVARPSGSVREGKAGTHRISRGSSCLTPALDQPSPAVRHGILARLQGQGNKGVKATEGDEKIRPGRDLREIGIARPRSCARQFLQH